MQWLNRNKPLVFIGAVVALLVVIGLLIWFTAEGWWPTIVDIVLVFTALASMGLLVALILAVVYLTRTVLGVKNEMMPVLHSLKTTTNAVREGAKTATVFGVDPGVRAASFLVGAGEVASVILGRGHAHKRADQRQRRRQQIERELAARGE